MSCSGRVTFQFSPVVGPIFPTEIIPRSTAYLTGERVAVIWLDSKNPESSIQIFSLTAHGL